MYSNFHLLYLITLFVYLFLILGIVFCYVGNMFWVFCNQNSPEGCGNGSRSSLQALSAERPRCCSERLFVLCLSFLFCCGALRELE